MMPPNARSILTTAISAKANASVANNTYLPTFEAGIVDSSQSEIAKCFHAREFGNGNSNAGTSGTWKDATMVDSTDVTLSFVMDDGLTCLHGNDIAGYDSGVTGSSLATHTGCKIYIIFIGTGVSIRMDQAGNHAGGDDYKWYIDGIEVQQWLPPENAKGIHVIAQDLPYGTHIFKIERVNASNQVQQLEEVTFHQPKMPHIPENATIISDYMLMADFVGHNVTGIEKISKGVRCVSSSRELSYNGGSPSFAIDETSLSGFRTYGQTAVTLPAFCTNFGLTGFSSRCELTKDGVNNTGLVTSSATNNSNGKMYFTNSFDPGQFTMGHVNSSGQNGNFGSYQVASPIHTSSHYQTFETPYLNELVGGDRNMEQKNLVVSADGKTWDEVTRDTSYIGNMRFQGVSGSDDSNSTQVFFPDDVRGLHGTRALGNKDFAIARIRLICLVDGQYMVGQRGRATAVTSAEIKINNTLCLQQSCGGTGSNSETFAHEVVVNLRRGDFITWNSPYNSGHYGDWWVRKI